MATSQGSNFEYMLKRDTLGPLRFQGDNVSYNSNGSIETGSSIPELTTAMDSGERSSFRAIRDSEVTQVKTADIQVHVPHNVDTPDSVASTGQRTFFTNGGPRHFNPTNLQQNHINKSMRDFLRDVHAESDDTDDISHEVNNNTEGSTKTTCQEEKREKKVLCWPKVVGFMILALVMVGGLVVLLHFKRDTNTGARKGQVLPDDPEDSGETVIDVCNGVEVKLKETMTIKCSLGNLNIYTEHLQYINITPPAYFNEGRIITVNISNEEAAAPWTASRNEFDEIHIQGSAATCSSSGKYALSLIDNDGQIMYNASVTIVVKSEVLKVNVTLNSTDSEFKLGCSTNSGCEQAFVDFFAEINTEEQFLRGVNFSCNITYNDYDGYSVSCVGNIPDFLLSQFEKVTCRPRSRLLDDLEEEDILDLETEIELPECDLTKHCNYKCLDTGDYYVVSEARCDIFHRCVEKQIFTSYCAPGTFFDPTECACRHTKELAWCQDNGALKPGTDVYKEKCLSS